MILKLLFSLLIFSSNTLWAQSLGGDTAVKDEAVADESEKEDSEQKKDDSAKERKVASVSYKSKTEVATEKEVEYLDLVIGVYKDVKYEDLPDDSIFDLEDDKYKEFTEIVYDNERKVMRYKPKKDGSFTLRFINKKRPNLIIKQVRVTVQQKNLDKIASEIENLLKEIEGIEIKILNNKVIVDGYILLAKDMNRIAMVLNQYNEKQVASLVRLSPLTKRKIADRIEAEIDNPNIYVDVINDFYLLEGTESWEGEAGRAEKIAQAHISDTLTKFAEGNARGGSQIKPLIKDASKIVVNNIIAVGAPKDPPTKMIQVIVHYVELSKDYSKGFNFSWAPTLNDTTGLEVSPGNALTNIAAGITATIGSLIPRLTWAREHGHARILNTMNVLTEEKVQGTVSSGTTIIRGTSGLGGQPPPPIEANVSTKVTPETFPDRPGDIKLDIEVDVKEVLSSDLTQSITTGNKIDTTVIVKNKKSAAIAGFLRSRTSSGYNRSPASGNLLFRLGADKSLEREHSQFVVFVTPVLKANSSQGVERVKKKFRIDK